MKRVLGLGRCPAHQAMLRQVELLVAVTRERRYGPSRLRANDDDDDLAPDRLPRQHPTTQFLQAGCPSCRPTNSVKALTRVVLAKRPLNGCVCVCVKLLQTFTTVRADYAFVDFRVFSQCFSIRLTSVMHLWSRFSW